MSSQCLRDDVRHCSWFSVILRAFPPRASTAIDAMFSQVFPSPPARDKLAFSPGKSLSSAVVVTQLWENLVVPYFMPSDKLSLTSLDSTDSAFPVRSSASSGSTGTAVCLTQRLCYQHLSSRIMMHIRNTYTILNFPHAAVRLAEMAEGNVMQHKRCINVTSISSFLASKLQERAKVPIATS